jgi:hypothetical protein
MTAPDFCALCVELLQAWQFGDDIAGPMNRARAALKTEPEGEGPRPDGDWFTVALLAQDMRSRGLAEQVAGEELLKLANNKRSQPGRPATLPAPDPGPTFQDAIRLAEGCHDYSVGHSGAYREAWHGAIDTVVDVLKRAEVGPWDSQTRAVYGVGVEAQAGEVAVPVAVSERLRIVRAGIRAGYNLGHHHTVEGGWGDPDEVADDIAQETLDDIGLPPAPQCLIARMANELDRLQPLPAFQPDTSHPLATEARALLRCGTTALPAPQAGEVAVPVPVAWCRSDEFANSMNRGGSFSGWKDPGAGINKCDMQLYAIPLPQAGEVKA